nr:retrovirus-related Pol polyprotein from transposon TNT 1-94 [Tanacetum cinerariifolium]
METKDTLSSCSDSDEMEMQRIQKKARIMKHSFQNSISILKSRFTLLSKKYIPCVNESKFGHAFSHIFDIKPSYDTKPITETAEYIMFAIESQHSEQPESINDTHVMEKDDSNVIFDSSNMGDNDNQADRNAEACDDKRVALANLIANSKLDIDENKKIQNKLKKTNTSPTQELKECKSTHELEKYKTYLNRTTEYDTLERLGYNAVPPSYTGNFLPLKPDLSGLEEFVNEPIVTEPTVKKHVSETSKAKASTDKPKGNPQMDLHNKGVIDSGCSRHITGNMTYLTDYEEIDKGYVTFGGNPKGGKITEAINTACYVQNRLLVVKPHNKTPYELFHGRTPALSLMRPFGCPVTILNTKDQLGKFNGNADERFFVGYFLNSKAFRVFNNRTRIVEENLHIRFSENTPNITRSGPN